MGEVIELKKHVDKKKSDRVEESLEKIAKVLAELRRMRYDKERR